jgi:hypothetical protein
MVPAACRTISVAWFKASSALSRVASAAIMPLLLCF